MPVTNALIIPGFGQTQTDGFKNIEAAFYKAGIKPVFVSIHWPRTVITQNTAEFEMVYSQYDPATTAIFGFSAGAQVAVVAAAKRSPAVLFLASMPGWFKEDLSTRSDFHKRMVGKRRVEDYKTLVFEDLASRITSITYIFVAENEVKPWPHFLHRAKDAHKKISNSQLITVPNSGHDISDINYLAAIKQSISTI